MSLNSPVGCGSMRQRFNLEYMLSCDGLVLEDDAAVKTPRSQLMMVRKPRTWFEKSVSIAWLVFAAFFVYYGDNRSNLISLLWSDVRIKRMALYFGLAGVASNFSLVLYMTLSQRCRQKPDEKYEALFSSAPLMVLLGLLTFCCMSFALWPIWSFMTIPLLFTLFMSSMILSAYLAIGSLGYQTFELHSRA